MGKIKHTKNELKKQRDDLRRFQRYLPTLILKKQQLQMEIRRIEGEIRGQDEAEIALQNEVVSWISLFSEPVDPGAYVSVAEIRESEGNIAGVDIPVLDRIIFDREAPDLFDTPPWLDDGVGLVEKMILVRTQKSFLQRQLDLLAEEMRVTSQRVNLFEKVKIPECKEHIRVIRIFLGDQQTASVARAKIAKGKSLKKLEEKAAAS